MRMPSDWHSLSLRTRLLLLPASRLLLRLGTRQQLLVRKVGLSVKNSILGAALRSTGNFFLDTRFLIGALTLKCGGVPLESSGHRYSSTR